MVAASDVPDLARDLVLRAQNHSKGVPDFINIKVEEVPEASCLRLKALPVRSLSCETAKEGLALNNGTQMMTAVGLNVLWDAMSLAKAADIACALTGEALHAIKKAPGNGASIAPPHEKPAVLAGELARRDDDGSVRVIVLRAAPGDRRRGARDVRDLHPQTI